MSLLTNCRSFFSRLFATNARTADEVRQQQASGRDLTYQVNEALYGNTIYDSFRSEVFRTCLPSCDPGAYIVPFFNPAREIVDAYLNVLPGTWGNGIDINPTIDGKPVNAKLVEPIRQVWRDSNLDTDKATIQRHAANLGTVGLRAQRKGEAKVAVKVDHPERLFHIEEDAEGNVTGAVLKYTQQQREPGPITDPKYHTVEIVEVITKDDFSLKIDDVEQLDDAHRTNKHGFCPYVVLKHKDNGTQFGDWAYRGSEIIWHRINYRVCQQDKSVGRHMFPKWFGAAGGDPPKEYDVGGGEKMSYVKMIPETPVPILIPLVPNLNQADAMKFWMECRDMNRGRQPELTINDVRLIAGISGETVMQVLKPAESAILSVRPAYDHALIRVMQMALSIGVDAGLFDVGQGTGDGAGDKSYKAGLESFQFKPRPALPQTPAQQTALAQAAVADKTARVILAKAADGIVDEEEQLRLMGYSDQDARAIMQRKRTADVIPTETL